jgi:hypothetical protein
MATNEQGQNPWECWVCQTRGRTIRSLLKQLKTPRDQAQEILKYLPKGAEVEYKQLSIIELPKEYQPLHNASQTSVVANLVKKYLYERGLTDIDFIKYGIGYCTTGEYGGRVIIPSFSESGALNFFIARTYDGNYFKYKNPEASKDIIFFENLINWNAPIILCEGVFDDIYIALDTDARVRALEIAEKFLNQGKRVFLINLPDKDPSDMGFKAFTNHVQTAEEFDVTSLLKHKLEL